MSENYPAVIPMIAYENGLAAMEWLTHAFGFRERTRMVGADGRLAHGEMDAGEGVIMLATPSPHYRGPRRHAEDCLPSRRWLDVPFIVDGVLVEVADLDSHYATARSAGAVILSEPQDDGHGRAYRAEDFEGHRWMFMQRS